MFGTQFKGIMMCTEENFYNECVYAMDWKSKTAENSFSFTVTMCLRGLKSLFTRNSKA